MTLRAVQFGAGNIGRGFLGQLYYETGYQTSFVDVVQPLLDALNERGEYPLRIVGDETRNLCIEDVSALHAGDTDAVAEALAQAHMASTAVGVNVLPKVAPVIAAGVARRFADEDAPPLDFIVCENLIGAGPFLREEVRKHLAPEFHAVLDERVGFVEASIGRMVPIMTDKEKAEDPLLVCVEPYCELPVDANGFKGPVPELKNMDPRQNFGAYVERKLFVHNLSHATAAYLGYLRGHEYIWQAVEDDRVRAEAEAALDETCRGLVAKHGLDPAALKAHADDLLHRYRNKALGDQIERIAKDPVRKLGSKDRLIGAGLMCLEQGIEPRHVAFAAAAAIRYDHPNDPAAGTVQQLLAERGLQGVLSDVCGLPPEAHLVELINDGIQRLQTEGWVE
ncbi:MAG: mannitol-1-phosphate 5-dehydrogenase [bacterium]|nr:mannitol-1-phosphate 5-dehydrogenase [bacterium]